MGSHWNHRDNDGKDDYGIQVKPVQFSYVDKFFDDDLIHIQHVPKHIHKSPNRHSAYEANINYGERYVEAVNLVKKVELPSEKQFVQQQLFVPTTTVVEEQLLPPPSQVQLITITTKIGDSFEENCKVEGDIKEEIIGEIFVEIDEKERSCLDAINVDFSKYLSLKGPHVSCSKENSRTSCFQEGMSNAGQYLPLFSVKTKIKKISKIILEQCHLIRILPVLRQ